MTYHTSLVFVVLSALLFVGCSKRPAHGTLTSSASFTIEPGVSIGPVRSGMTMDQVITALGEPDQKRDSGSVLEYQSLGLTVLGRNKAGLIGSVICLDSGKKRPSAKPFAGHTKEGVGIGASRADVISTYGEPTVTEELGGPEHEQLIYRPLGIRFDMTEGRVSSIAIWFKITP